MPDLLKASETLETELFSDQLSKHDSFHTRTHSTGTCLILEKVGTVRFAAVTVVDCLTTFKTDPSLLINRS
jgi:hypothetical protein